MNVVLYNNSSSNNTVHKRLSQIGTVDCDVYEDCSISSPTLRLSMTDAMISANYCYIAKFGRYYYITDKTIIDGSILIVSTHVDVLMSHWSSFSTSPCIAKRSSSHPNINIPDEYNVYKSQSKFIRRKDSNKFNPSSTGGCYILTLGGK